MADAARKATGLQVIALDQLRSDPTVTLSAPSQILVSSLATGLETALGKDISKLSQEAAEAVGNFAADAVGELAGSVGAEVIADVLVAVPYIGWVIKAVQVIVQMLTGGENREEADARYCAFLRSFAPKPTGSALGGGSLVPADIFACVHPVDNTVDGEPRFFNYRLQGGSSGRQVARVRSVLGMALMAVTEGRTIDPADVDWQKEWKRSGMGVFSADEFRRGWEADQKYYLKVDTDAFNEKSNVQRLAHDIAQLPAIQAGKRKQPVAAGISPQRVKQFTALRLAMEACHGPDSHSDGGVSLWPAYLDLLRGEFEAGHLSPMFVQNRISYVNTFGEGDLSCAPAVAAQVMSLVEQWDHTVNPYYVQGEQKLDELKGLAAATATATAQRVVAAQATQKPSGAAIKPTVTSGGVETADADTTSNAPLIVVGVALAGLAALALRPPRARRYPVAFARGGLRW